MNDHHRVMLEEMLLMAYSKTWKERSDEKIEVEKYMDIVIECCAKEQLVSCVFLLLCLMHLKFPHQ